MMYRIWYVPQIPCESFKREYSSVEECLETLELLTDFSRFEYENKIKPDYSEMFGMEYWCDDDQCEEDWCEIDGFFMSEHFGSDWEYVKGTYEDILRYMGLL